MKSIFVRIYGGLVLVVIGIAVMSWAGIQLVNGWRAEVYREQMSRGTFYLLARGVERQKTEEEEQRWLEVLGRLMGSEIALRELTSVDLEASQQQRLAAGHVLMLLNESQGSADIYYQVPGQQRLLYTRMSKVSEQQARATALLILDELAQYPLAEWDQVFERISDHFGFPLSRVAYNKLRLDREQLQRLQRREVVMAFDESGSRRSSIQIYAPVGNTGTVLVMGPMALFDQYPIEMFLVLGVMGLSVMALATYSLLRPLQVRLYRLSKAVEQVDKGDLDVQVKVGSFDAIGHLAATFNGMTQHIRRLIDSQREMTRAVSHELRTPVARLRFGVEILADTESAEQRQEKLEELDRDIEQLDQLIDEILTFARLEQGSPVLEYELLDVTQLLQRMQNELDQLAGAIRIEIDEAVLPAQQSLRYAEAEPRYLHRVLQNLITNATRYASSRVVLRYRVDDGGMAVLEVEDDGEGIKEVDRIRIFEPFARLDESRQRQGKSGGYGLGLSIVKRIVEWHGGRIEITRGQLGGALFRVAWPRRHQGPHVLGALNDQ